MENISKGLILTDTNCESFFFFWRQVLGEEKTTQYYVTFEMILRIKEKIDQYRSLTYYKRYFK